MKIRAALLGVLVFVVMASVSAWVIYRLTCAGQCATGSKHCQDMCFKKGECPYGWQP